jgi:hypothetical protein
MDWWNHVVEQVSRGLSCMSVEICPVQPPPVDTATKVVVPDIQHSLVIDTIQDITDPQEIQEVTIHLIRCGQEKALQLLANKCNVEFDLECPPEYNYLEMLDLGRIVRLCIDHKYYSALAWFYDTVRSRPGYLSFEHTLVYETFKCLKIGDNAPASDNFNDTYVNSMNAFVIMNLFNLFDERYAEFRAETISC